MATIVMARLTSAFKGGSAAACMAIDSNSACAGQRS
eukprot:CAMPEP_0115231218 /NCGR_PEP_ID=MMETSP0270-20121206/33124_1 /TAXON_ID=71861 /ORGANISM="Scrippsiella trochoidea, Strain CCMP3099" /LENGTH=35 /DNA_ID= /DNA_START= /DNA_END= /DNA_ORIENTATION=